eukprot:scaffold245118_cov38-Prasinocladus_malaysianus.AAC.1
MFDCSTLSADAQLTAAAYYSYYMLHTSLHIPCRKAERNHAGNEKVGVTMQLPVGRINYREAAKSLNRLMSAYNVLCDNQRRSERRETRSYRT